MSPEPELLDLRIEWCVTAQVKSFIVNFDVSACRNTPYFKAQYTALILFQGSVGASESFRDIVSNDEFSVNKFEEPELVKS